MKKQMETERAQSVARLNAMERRIASPAEEDAEN